MKQTTTFSLLLITFLGTQPAVHAMEKSEQNVSCADAKSTLVQLGQDIAAGDLSAVQQFVKTNNKFISGDVPLLLMAAGHNQYDIAEFLLQQGAPVDAQSPYQRCTPLERLIRLFDNPKFAQLLVSYGAEVNPERQSYYDPSLLQIAVNLKRTETVKVLKQAGARENSCYRRQS